MDSSRIRPPLAIAATILALLVLGSIWVMESVIDDQREREIDRWQKVLHTLADQKRAALERWLLRNFADLGELSQNNALRLYARALSQQERGSPVEPAQKAYLHNLIKASAERLRFSHPSEQTPSVQADLAKPVHNLLMLVDRDLAPLASSAGPQAILPALKQAILQSLQAAQPLILPLPGSGDRPPQVCFILPVYPLQAMSDNPQPFAALVGVQDAELELYPLLASFGKMFATLESYLIEPQDNYLLYASPLMKGASGTRRRPMSDIQGKADDFAITHPDSFATSVDYHGDPVLLTSRNLELTPWTLVQKIDLAEALQDFSTYQAVFRIAFSLGLIALCLLLIAAWWYGSSTRAKAAAKTLRAQSVELTKQAALLQAVTDSTQDMLLMVRENQAASFANEALAKRLGMSTMAIAGKRLNELFGVELGALLSQLLEQCVSTQTPINAPLEATLRGQPRYFHAALVPVPFNGTSRNSALISLHDLTELEQARMRQADLTQQLIDALMSAIDRHDPYSAHHSAKTSQVAMTLAETMQLAARDRRTLDIASRLCNLGKLLIPHEVLTKTGELTHEELALIRQEPWHAEELLKSIEFEGPVLETIMQKHEYLDGSGYPRGLKDAEVLATSRILTVANDFVAMVSPRAYRDRLPAEQALQQLLSLADYKYDRQVVAALFHLVENQLDLHDW